MAGLESINPARYDFRRFKKMDKDELFELITENANKRNKEDKRADDVQKALEAQEEVTKQLQDVKLKLEEKKQETLALNDAFSSPFEINSPINKLKAQEHSLQLEVSGNGLVTDIPKASFSNSLTWVA